MRSTAIDRMATGRAAIDRRSFLALAGAASLVPRGASAAPDEPLFLGARLSGDHFEAAVIDAHGRDRLVLPLETRGHSFAVDKPRRRAVAFARSPGRFAIAFSVDGRAKPQAFAAAPGRHFFGHGAFTPDGKLMLATENAYEDGAGVTGLYDATDGFRRIGEFPTAGIGPHEVVLMPDRRIFCVANGGILTHPDYPRQKLNLPDMSPSLVYLDIQTGEIVEKIALPPDLHRLSIRHLAVDGRGHVWFGCQYEGEVSDGPPLVGRHRRGREPELFSGPTETLRAMRNYVGSLAMDASGAVLATSSPEGGVIVFWDTATGRCLGQRALVDGCGVAPLGHTTVLATSGRGAIVQVGPDDGRVVTASGVSRPQWDNHLRAV